MKYVVLVGIGVIILASGWWYFDLGRWFGAAQTQEPLEFVVATTTRVSYVSEEYHIAFLYPEYYFVHEQDIEDGAHAITLFEDTEENRKLVSGDLPADEGGREGPPTMSIIVFDNREAGLTAEEWVRTDRASNFALSPDNLLTTLEVASSTAYFYRFSGLYEGYALAVGDERRIFLFTVSFLDTEDRIIDDYNDLLESVSFL